MASTQIYCTTPSQPSIHFKTIDWWVMRTDFSTDKVVVAGKAGKNDDPHHGHLDIGHFVVYWNKECYIRDLGKVDMTKNTLIKPF